MQYVQRCWANDGFWMAPTGATAPMQKECQTVVPDDGRIGLCERHANEIIGPVGAK